MKDILHATEELKEKKPILVVDDNEINCEVLSIIFSAYEVVIAHDGEEAFNILRGNKDKFSAVLLDYVMPKMDGLAFLKKVKDEQLLSNTPIFLITSEEDDSLAFKAFELGIVDFIQRPISAFIVLKRVEAFIELFKTRDVLQRLLDVQTKKYERINRGVGALVEAVVANNPKENNKRAEKIREFSAVLLRDSELGAGLTEKDFQEIIEAINLIGIRSRVKDESSQADFLDDLIETGTFETSKFSKLLALYRYEKQAKNAQEISKSEATEVPLWLQAVRVASMLTNALFSQEEKGIHSFDETIQRVLSGNSGNFAPLVLESTQRLYKELKAVYDQA